MLSVWRTERVEAKGSNLAARRIIRGAIYVIWLGTLVVKRKTTVQTCNRKLHSRHFYYAR